MTTDDVNNTQGASSLQGVDGRASGTENTEQERRWLVIELLSSITGWCRTGSSYKTVEAARHELTAIDFGGRARLVEVVERTKIVEEWKAGSPIVGTERA